MTTRSTRSPVAAGVASLAGLAGLLLVGVGGAPVTLAGFTDSASLTSGSMTSGVMTAPAAPEVRQVPGPGSTRVRWSAPPMGEHGGAPSSYEVYRYPDAAGGPATLACSVDVGTGTDVGRALECDDTSRDAGTHHYAVRARQGDSWQAESGRVDVTPDLTGPTTTLTDPADGYRGSGFFLRLGLAFSCGGSPGCGTASDPAGIAAVRWTLALRVGGSGRVRCYDGNGYGGPQAEDTCPERGAVVESATGGVRWRLPGGSGTAFSDRGAYRLTVTAVDGFGSTTTVRNVVTVT